MKRLFQIILAELVRTGCLIAAILIAVGIFVQLLFGQSHAGEGFWQGLWRFVTQAHRNKDGLPLAEAIWPAAGETLPLAGLALLFLFLFSLLVGTLLATRPRCGPVKFVVLALSAIPSFMWPFLVYLVSPGIPFRGFHSDVLMLWPALALAVGDLNLITVSQQHAETLRQELGRPHVRVLRILGLSAALHVWPRSAVGLLGAIGARIPHLLGGTIALELLYNINGLGWLTWKSIMDVPPDYRVILWVCGLGIVVSRGFHLVHRLGSALLLPQAGASKEPDRAKSDSQPSEPSEAPRHGRPSRRNESPPVSPLAPAHLPDTPGVASSCQIAPLETPIPAPPGFVPLRIWWRRIRYYLRLNRMNWAKLALVVTLWGICIWFVFSNSSGDLSEGDGDVFESPSASYRLGTDAMGESVLRNLVIGAQQQAPALLTAVGIAVLCVPAGFLGLFASMWKGSWWHWPLKWLSSLIDAVVELVDSIPKIIILLAAFSYFTTDDLVPKMYKVIGVIFIPQLYRALRDELAVLSNSVFLEAARITGVSTIRILWQNVLRNHCSHVVLIQLALMAGCIIHVDALMGFVGVRSRGEIYTWGSMLGMGVEEFMQFRPLQALVNYPFNPWVVWGPFLGVWLTVLVAWTLADALKIPVGGYVYRLNDSGN